MNIFDLLKKSIELGASDIHITVNSTPIARVKGSFVNLSEIVLNYGNREQKELILKKMNDIYKKLNNTSFETIAFSMSFDFDFMGVLEILDKYKIPFESKNRDENQRT